MSEDNNKKDEKGYSFIQEQIASKKKFRYKKMLYSVAWTTVLACIFGLIAGVVFYISGPAITRILGKYQDKKSVEFPTVSPEDNNDTQGASGITPTPTGSALEDSEDDLSTDPVTVGADTSSEEGTDTKPNTVVIENYIRADIQDLSNIYLELRNIAAEVSHSIVKVTSISNGIDWFGNEYEVIIETTGLVVANNEADLLVLVSLDKIKDAIDIKISINDDLQVKAKLQDQDSDLNLAIISISLENLPEDEAGVSIIKPASLGESYSLIVGSPVLALGSPNGYVNSMELGMITSKGSSVYITDNKIDLFNTDINQYSNGDGVVVNLRGEVIGIITHKLKDEQNQEINTVIGISKIKKTIENLVNNKDRSYFGIIGADMTEAALLKAGIETGICITEVETDSPALVAGLQSGDMIVALNDTPVSTVNTFYNLIMSYAPKTTIKVSIRRNVKNTPKDIEVNVTLGKKSG